jgi:hypothetical protein
MHQQEFELITDEEKVACDSDFCVVTDSGHIQFVFQFEPGAIGINVQVQK